jgi:predicted porin
VFYSLKLEEMKMKKILMSTTALVAASVALAGIASAEVKVSGSTSYFLTYKSGAKSLGAFYDEAVKSNEYQVNLGVQQLTWQSEVVVSGGGVTDAGLNYGAEAQLRTGIDSVTTDEAFVHIGGDSWGKITLGNDDDALDRTQVHAGSVAVGLGHEWNGTGNKLGGNDDDAKIVYQTPSFSGFNAALSLSPTAANGQENLIAAGANFSRDLGGMSFKVGAGARMSSTANRTDATANGVEVGKETGGVFGFQAGVSGTFNAFSLSLGFGSGTTTTSVAAAKDTENAATNMGLTVAYNYGQGGVSASYLLGSGEVMKGATKGNKTSSNSIVLDADYKMAEGLAVQFEAAINSNDPNGDVADVSGQKAPSNMIIGVGLNANF